jgi:aminoglycoside phosphotransferase (APT) family kinase protein
MTEEFQLNDDIYTGTKEVSENLKFESKLLQEWINDNVKDSGSIKKIEQFKGGQSNPTYKILTENNAYVLRRKPPGKLLPKAHAVDREYKVITALYETDVPVPKTYGLCEDDSVVGTPFFLMEFVDGTVYWDHMLPKCSPEERTLIYKNKNKVIASLHSVDYKEVGLEDYGKSGNYVARQVNTWTKQYLASETENIDEMNKLIEWLPKNIPEDDETSVVHGDFRLDNMIYSNFDVAGVLDWELSTLGHPIADFCYHCLTWRTLPNFHDHAKLKDLGIPNEMQYRDMYSEQTGKDLSQDWEFYMVYSLFKVAAICQGILGRVRDGTAASKHAEERGMNVFPLSKGAWSIVESNF